MKLGLVAVALVLAVSLAVFGCVQQGPAATPTPSPQAGAVQQAAAEGEIDSVNAELDEIDSLVGSLDAAEINESGLDLT
ncbi:MAG: hypothetical protein AB1626_02945 [Candidatus Micrarchaeota archaeon]